MKRSIASVAGLAALIVGVTGCSSSGGSGGKSGSITVAFPVPITSGNSVAAAQMVDAAKLAIKDINAAGGAGGRTLKLKVYDDGGTPDGATQVVQRGLTVDGAKVIVGGYSSAEALAVRTVAERQKTVYMSTSSVGPQVTSKATYTFRTTINQKDYAPPMARAIKNLGKSRPAILSDTGPVGSTLPPDVVSALKGEGITAQSPVSYTLNSTDVSSSVSKVVAQKPDSLIIISSASADQGLIVKTMVEQGLRVPVVGFGSLAAGNAIKIGGAAYGKLPGVYTLANTSPGKPDFDNLIKKYAAAYGGNPAALETTINEQVPETYDGFMLIKQALDATKGDTSGSALAKALHALKPYSTPASGKVGARISFAGTQDGFHDSISIFKLTNGTVAVAPALNKA